MQDEPKLTVFHGDGFEMLDGIKQPFIVVTDPPFNIGYHYNEYDDDVPKEEYYRLMGEILSYGDGAVMIHYPEELLNICFENNIKPNDMFTWVYNSNCQRQHRDAWYFRGAIPNFRKMRQPYKNMKDKRNIERMKSGKSNGAMIYDWYYCNQVKNKSKNKTEHPCQMPVEIMRRIIGVLPEKYAIADPFGGSGSTMVAAMSLGRDCYISDIDEKYIDIIKSRADEYKQISNTPFEYDSWLA